MSLLEHRLPHILYSLKLQCISQGKLFLLFKIHLYSIIYIDFVSSDVYGGQYGQYNDGATATPQYDPVQGTSSIDYDQNFGQVHQNMNIFNPVSIDEPLPQTTGGRAGRTTRSSRGGFKSELTCLFI